MNKFSVLPTDKRFLNLYEEQKIALFEGIIQLPEDCILKRNTIINRQKEKIENYKDDEIMTKGLQKRMLENFINEGKTQDEARAIIKNNIELKRQQDLKELERMKNE